MGLAEYAGTASKDPSTKVGAVVVGAGDRRKVAFGYNGFPPGIKDDDRLFDRPMKLKLMIHAERNALDNATFDCTGATIYAARLPCSSCAVAIISKRVGRVVYRQNDDYETRWAEDVAVSKKLFDEAGVELFEIIPGL